MIRSLMIGLACLGWIADARSTAADVPQHEIVRLGLDNGADGNLASITFEDGTQLAAGPEMTEQLKRRLTQVLQNAKNAGRPITHVHLHADGKMKIGSMTPVIDVIWSLQTDSTPTVVMQTSPLPAKKVSLEAAKPKKLVLIAGKPSHPPRMHEFNAGVQLLAKCLKESAPQVSVTIALNGWPQDEKVFDEADAVVFYMDGREKHEAVQEQGTRLKKIQALVDRGVGIGCMHYAVEVVPDQAGAEFKRWIGGHYEHMHSVNPAWEPAFTEFPTHPITRGVKPFQIKDEWYFNMRFVDGFTGEKPAERDGLKFTPILNAVPSDAVRDGPYVFPKGPYPHIQAAKGRVETMLWAVERPDGGRGFGFTGGHFHDNWGNDEFRKIVLNALVWVAKGEVPASGIESKVTPAEIEANLDPKPVKK